MSHEARRKALMARRNKGKAPEKEKEYADPHTKPDVTGMKVKPEPSPQDKSSVKISWIEQDLTQEEMEFWLKEAANPFNCDYTPETISYLQERSDVVLSLRGRGRCDGFAAFRLHPKRGLTLLECGLPIYLRDEENPPMTMEEVCLDLDRYIMERWPFETVHFKNNEHKTIWDNFSKVPRETWGD